MAFEDLIKLQAYLRGDGRNYAAEAINKIYKRRDESKEREEKRDDVFEAQRRSQEFQREQTESSQTFQEKLVGKQAEAYLDRLKAVQGMKLDSLYPKQEGETDAQRSERVGKQQAGSINDLLDDVAASEAEIEKVVGAETAKKEARLKTLASRSPTFLDALDKKTALALQGGTIDVDQALAALAKKSPQKAADARAALDSEMELGRDKVPDLTPQAQIRLRNLQKEAEAAEKRANLLLRTFEQDGTFLGAPFLRSTRRATAAPSVKPEDFKPPKTSPAGGSPGAGGASTITPGAGPVNPAEPGAPVRLPGRGVVPNFLNESVIEPVAKYLPLGAEVAGGAVTAPFRDSATALGNVGRYLFTGAPQQPFEIPTERFEALPLPMEDQELGGALRAPVRNAPLAANVTVADLQNFMANELGMAPDQIQQHFSEKASGDPEAAQAERQLLSEILQRRAMPTPGQPALMR